MGDTIKVPTLDVSEEEIEPTEVNEEDACTLDVSEEEVEPSGLNEEGTCGVSAKDDGKENMADDRLNLLGAGSMTCEEEKVVIALVRGTGSPNEVIMKVKGNDISREDIRRLDGPRVPVTKRPIDLWLNDKILAFM